MMVKDMAAKPKAENPCCKAVWFLHVFKFMFLNFEVVLLLSVFGLETLDQNEKH
jgi:hypothetical protein